MVTHTCHVYNSYLFLKRSIISIRKNRNSFLVKNSSSHRYALFINKCGASGISCRLWTWKYFITIHIGYKCIFWIVSFWVFLVFIFTYIYLDFDNFSLLHLLIYLWHNIHQLSYALNMGFNAALIYVLAYT